MKNSLNRSWRILSSLLLLTLVLSATGCRENCEKFPGAESRLSQLLATLRAPDTCAAFRTQLGPLLTDARWLRGLEHEFGNPARPRPSRVLSECRQLEKYSNMPEAGACVGLAEQAAIAALETACRPLTGPTSVPAPLRARKIAEAEGLVTEAIVKSEEFRKEVPKLCKCITDSPEFPEGCTWHFYDPREPGVQPVFRSSRNAKPELGGCGFFGSAGPADAAQAQTERPRGGGAN